MAHRLCCLAPQARISIALAACLFSSPLAAVTIDDFEVGDFTYTDDGTVSGATFYEGAGLDTASVAGGVRYVSLVATNETLPTLASAALATAPEADDGALLSITGDPAGLGSFSFAYDGIDAGGGTPSIQGSGGALGLNLLDTRLLEVNATVVGDANVRLTLWSSTGTDSTSFIPLVNGITVFALNDFALSLADIQAIRVSINGIGVGESVRLNDISTVVPEPATGFMLAAGLVCVAVRRRRARG